MSEYIQFNISLSDCQKESLKKAFRDKTNVSLRFTHDELKTKGNDKLLLTNRQINHINKCISKGVGGQVTLSKSQMKKQGGFLPFLIPLFTAALPALIAAGKAAAIGAATAAGGLAVNGIANAVRGNGINPAIRSTRPLLIKPGDPFFDRLQQVHQIKGHGLDTMTSKEQADFISQSERARIKSEIEAKKRGNGLFLPSGRY